MTKTLLSSDKQEIIIGFDAPFCVIGERTQSELFEDNENPVGDYIQISGVFFQVVGVHKYIPGGGFESDSDIFIPFTTFRKLYNNGDRVTGLLLLLMTTLISSLWSRK